MESEPNSIFTTRRPSDVPIPGDMVAASCVQEPEPRVYTCRVKRCLDRRQEYGEQDGRFLMEVWQDEGAVYIRVICPDCKTHHLTTIIKTK
jgi:hypothetical protein